MSAGQEPKKLPAVLAPTKVHLKFDDTPVDQAVAGLSREIGYLIFLDDPAGKLKNRAITLDTGEATYWEAVEKLCAKAGLVEGIPALGLTPKELPTLPPPPKPGEKIPLLKIGEGTPLFRTIRGVMTLKDGKPPEVSADTSSAVRVKPSGVFSPPATPTELTCGLKVSPEPKLRWNDVLGIRIDRAVDDNEQKLQQAKKADVPKFGGVFGGGVGVGKAPQLENDNTAHVVVRLTKGAKASSKLKELKGAITASVSVFGEEVLVVADVVKSQGKVIKGVKGGAIKVGAAKVDEQGDVQIAVELGLLPAWSGSARIGGGNSSAPLPGLKVLDAAAKAIPIVSMTPSNPNTPAGGSGEYLVKLRPARNQTVTRISYSARRDVTVEIPFALTDVAVP